jgi:hypothetical protein
VRGAPLLQILLSAAAIAGGARLWCAPAGGTSLEPGARPSAAIAGPAPELAQASGSGADPLARRSESSDAAATTSSDGDLAGAAADEPARGVSRSSRARRPRTSGAALATIPPLAEVEPPRIPELLARVALRFVGRDAAAERTWIEAIDQPGLGEEARVDLIEDLNEEGFADPDELVPADLPLIVARLRIIERLAPHAMDAINAASFEEAYRDLLSMRARLEQPQSR